MTCSQASELLAAYADGGLQGRERDMVVQHLRGCASCTEEVRLLRELLSDVRRLGAPEPREESFWHDLSRDIRVSVAAAQPAVPWWRLPAIGAAFALAAAAVLWVYVRGEPAAVRPQLARPTHALPQSYEVDDLDGRELAAVNQAFEADDPPPSDEELALASPAGAETLVENLDDEDVARLGGAL